MCCYRWRSQCFVTRWISNLLSGEKVFLSLIRLHMLRSCHDDSESLHHAFLPTQCNSFYWAGMYSLSKLHDHTQTRHTRWEWSARRRDLYLTTNNTHKRHPCLCGIQTRNPSKQVAADPRLRPRGRWDQPANVLATKIHKNKYHYIYWNTCSLYIPHECFITDVRMQQYAIHRIRVHALWLSVVSCYFLLQ